MIGHSIVAPQEETHKFSNKVAVDVETTAVTTTITTGQE